MLHSANTFHLPYMSFIEFYLECVLQKFVCVNIILVHISSLKPVLYMKLKLHFSFLKNTIKLPQFRSQLQSLILNF